MKFLTTLTFFFVAFIALGQNQQSNASKITDTEKKRLENEFRALGSFYIDNSGLVVYDNTSQEEKSSESKDKSEKIQDPIPTIKEDIQNETPIVDQTPPQKNTSENAAPPIIRIKTTNSPNTAFYKKEIIDKEVETSHHEIENTEEIEIETPRKPNTQVVATKKEDIESSTKEKSVTDSKVSKTTQKKGSILNQRRESQYKSMEEAALAVEALLEELKKEEGQITTSGSMSSKLSRGVNKNLRKKSDNANSNSFVSQESSNTTDDNSSRFGVEPSYFINGVQVEKVEVSKLNKKDIIRREIRVRNTVTGNPNGEVWYEVK